MGQTLTDFASVVCLGFTYVFYISKDDGHVAFYRQSETDPTDESVNYKSYNIDMEPGAARAEASTSDPAIAAVSYEVDGNLQIRIYVRSPSGYLRELCWEGSTPGDTPNYFFEGELTTRSVVLEHGTCIASSVPQSGKLKVYAVKQNEEVPTMFYVPINRVRQATAWKERKII